MTGGSCPSRPEIQIEDTFGVRISPGRRFPLSTSPELDRRRHLPLTLCMVAPVNAASD